MAAVMYLSFVTLIPLLWLGALSARGILIAVALLLLSAMAGAMLLRRNEYTSCSQPTRNTREARRA